MKGAIGIAVVLIASGCDSGEQQAERRMEMARHAGNAQEVCKQARAIADYYLQKGDQDRYNQANNEADIYCLGSSLGVDPRTPPTDLNAQADDAAKAVDRLSNSAG